MSPEECRAARERLGWTRETFLVEVEGVVGGLPSLQVERS